MNRTKKLCGLLFAGLFASMAMFAGCATQDNGEHLFVNKTEFLRNEEIYVSAEQVGDQNTWYGLFRESDKIDGSVQAIRWQYVNRGGYFENTYYGLQHSTVVSDSRIRFANIPAGNYKIVLYARDDYKIACDICHIKVLSESIAKPQAPLSLTYTLKNPTDGLAEGEVGVTFDENSPASELIMYWANEDGVLQNYTALATVKITGLTQTIQMTDKTLIPAEATHLRAYSKNNAGVSDDYCEIALPAGCQYNYGGQPLSEFQVVSDIHISSTMENLAPQDSLQIHDDHFLAMCRDVAANSPQSDGVFVVGDIANNGRLAEWQHMEQLKNSVEGVPQFYFAMGNHDTILGMQNAKNYFFEFAKTDSIYYERVVGGYHHIFLGQENAGEFADMTPQQLAWLENTLASATAQQPNKPVFVYLHQSLANTVAGSLGGNDGQSWNGVLQENELRAILAKYPQVVMFNGHSHWDMNSEKNMFVKNDNLPNIFNTSSVGYLWSSFYIGEGVYLQGSQGYYIKVFEDKMLVLGRDFESGKWIPSACYEAKI